MQSTKASINAANAATAGRAPLPDAASGVARFAHTSASGFCSVCGSVWPCARADQEGDVPMPSMPSMRRPGHQH